MENEIQNGVVVNANGNGVANSVANSESVKKIKITNEVLVELGFPQAVAYNNINWVGWNSKDFKIVSDFYNALSTLAKIYEKYTSKKLKLSKNGFSVFLNDKEVFSCYASHKHFYKHQNLKKIKEIINKLLLTKFNNLEELKQEFAEVYEKEKAKNESNENEILIYNWRDNFLTRDEQEYENRKNQFIEALKSDNEFAEKEVLYIKIPRFEKEYSLEGRNLKLKNILIRTMVLIRIYQNFLIFQTTRNPYVVELSEIEKQKILNLLTLFKI